MQARLTNLQLCAEIATLLRAEQRMTELIQMAAASSDMRVDILQERLSVYRIDPKVIESVVDRYIAAKAR